MVTGRNRVRHPCGGGYPQITKEYCSPDPTRSNCPQNLTCGDSMAEKDDDRIVLLVADLHKSADEALANRRRAAELIARAWRVRSDYLAVRDTSFTTSMAQVTQTKPPLYVRRWPGVDRRL